MSIYLTRLQSIFRVPEDNPDLVIAQIHTFSKQIPIMYGMVIINTIALAYIHFSQVPTLLSIYIPGALVTIAGLRTIVYWRAGKREILARDACRQLRQTIILAGLLGGVFSMWALTLFTYGNAHTQSHVAFFSSVTGLGILVCLMHLRAAAIVLTLAAIGPTVVFLLYAGSQVYTVVGINLLIVAIAVLYVLSNYSRSFVELIANQSTLKKKVLEAHELSNENERLANLDSLTSLPNRRRFMSELDQRLNVSSANDTNFTVGILDLDGFKPINDIYGHIAGDRLLIKVGQRLSQISEEIFVARLGGDEFGIIFGGNLSNTEITTLGDHICDAVRIPFDLDSFKANIGGSFGLARYPDAGETAELLFERADYALYAAKEHSKGRTVLFSEKHHAEIKKTTGIKRELREANLEDELSLNFQFIVDSSTGAPVGAEALARWSSPVLGDVSPMDFIKNAEQTGIISQLTEILLHKTLTEVSKWPEDLFISFNLSAHDIGSAHHIKRLIKILLDSKFPPERLTFEITETDLLHDLSRAKETLLLLKSLGSKVALDDFGVGYSSLSYVQSLPIDRLKIDRSFIIEIEESRTSQAVVKTIIDLCSNLDLDCVVEGVETEGQLQILRDLGCKKIQGYLFSRPLPSKDALTYLDAVSKAQNQTENAPVAIRTG